jgi:hypothetical protein
MVPFYLAVKTDGTVYAGLHKEDIYTLSNTALRLEINSEMLFGKIFTVGGSAGAYTATNNDHSDGFGNLHAKTF